MEAKVEPASTTPEPAQAAAPAAEPAQTAQATTPVAEPAEHEPDSDTTAGSSRKKSLLISVGVVSLLLLAVLASVVLSLLK